MSVEPCLFEISARVRAVLVGCSLPKPGPKDSVEEPLDVLAQEVPPQDGEQDQHRQGS